MLIINCCSISTWRFFVTCNEMDWCKNLARLLLVQSLCHVIILFPTSRLPPASSSIQGRKQHQVITTRSNWIRITIPIKIQFWAGFPQFSIFMYLYNFSFFLSVFFLYVRVCVCLFSSGTSFFRLFRLLLRWVIFDPFDTKMNSAPKTELVFFFLFVTEVRILSLRHNGHCWLDISTSAAVLQSPFRWRFNSDAIVSLDEMSQCHCRNAIVACRIPIFDWFLCRLSGKGPGERWGIRTGTALCCQLNALVKSRSQSNKRQTSVWIAGLTAR